jgi:hypothetical protein
MRRAVAVLIGGVCLCTPQPAAGLTAPSEAGTPSGLVAAYGFEEGAGTVAGDASGHGHPGTLEGAAWTPAGRFGGGLVLDGIDDRVTVPDANDLDPGGPLTMMAWVRPSQLGSAWRTAIMKERPGGLAYALYAHTAARGPSAHVTLAGKGEPRARATAALPAGTWTHLAAVYDGAAIRVYRDGTEIATQAATGTPVASDGPLRLGGNAIWNEWFAGTLDEVRVYARALPAAEITAVMGGPMDSSPPSAPALGLAEDAAGGQVVGTTLHYRPGSSGRLTVTADSADPESGIARLRFPVVFGGDGGEDVSAPYAREYLWGAAATADGAFGVTAVNGAGTQAGTDFTVRRDAQPPAGAAIAYAGGYDADGTVAVATDPGTDSGAGLDPAATAVERQTAALADGACGAFGAWEPAATDDRVAHGRCARYRLRVSDRVGNEAIAAGAATVRVDLTAPDPPALVLAEDDPSAEAAGTELLYSPARAGRFAVRATGHDAESGIARVDFAAPQGMSGGGASLAAPFGADYAWEPGSGAVGAVAVTATNAAGLSATAAFTVTPDAAAPAGQAITVAGGPFHTGPVAFATADGTDAGAGVDPASRVVERGSATLAGGACGPFGDWSGSVASPDASAASGRCYRYRVSIADRVGNRSAWAESGEARVDATPPSRPVLALGGFTAASATGSTVFYRPGAAGGFTVTAVAADAESGVAGYAFPELGLGWSGADGAYAFAPGAAPPGAPAEVTARNRAGGTSAGAALSVIPDATPPATTDDAPGAPSSGPVTVRLAASDGAGSGVARTEHRVDGGLWTEGAEAAFPAPADHSGDGEHALAYRSTDAVGNAEPERVSRVTVDTRPPAPAAASVAGTAVVVTFGEPLAAAAPPAGAFTVTRAGGASAHPVRAEPVATGDAAVRLELAVADAPSWRDDVTVAYDPAAAGAARLRDRAGNAVEGFDGVAARNDTPDRPPSVTPVSPAAGTTSATATPLLTARYDDPDPGDPGSVAFDLCGQAGCAAPGDPVATASSPTGLASGADGSATVAAGALADGRTYHWRARARDGRGLESPPSATRPLSVDLTPPGAPPSLTRDAATQTTVSVSWLPATDNLGVAGYGLYRDGVLVATTSATQHVFDGLACGRQQRLAVDAVDRAGRRSPRALLNTVTAACETDMVAAYAFDERSGATAADASGRGHAGAVAGAAWSTSGRYGGALAFDGVDDRVTVASTAALRLTGPLTIEAWVRPSSLGGTWRTAVMKERPGGLAYALYAHTGQRGPSGHVRLGNAEPRARATAVLPLATWTHLATTYDGATIRVYRNGAEVATQAATGAVADSDGPLQIGANQVWSEPFAGLIDEVRVYRRALAPADIGRDMATALDGSPPSAPGLTLAESGADTHAAGTTLHYRPGGPGAFTVSATSSDPESGIGLMRFPAVAGGDGGEDADPPFQAAYALAGGGAAGGEYPVTAVNGTGLDAESSFTLAPDAEAPAGGSIAYHGGYATGGAVAIAAEPGTDAGAGLDPGATRLERSLAPLAGGACGAFEAGEGAATPDALPSGRCARYRLRVADRVGNEAVHTAGEVARADLSPPEIDLLAPVEGDGEDGQHFDAATATHWFRPSAAGSFRLGATAGDPESGAGAPVLPDLAAVEGWTAGEEGYAWAPGAVAPGPRLIRAANGAGLTGTAALTIAADEQGPSGGSVSYPDGVVADGAVAIAVDPGTDAGAGIDPASDVLERATAPLQDETACGAFGAWTLTTAPDALPEATCARYRYRVADRVGNATVYGSAHVVRVPQRAEGTVPPAIALAEDEPDEHAAGTMLFYNGNPGGAGRFTVSAEPSGGGVLRVRFPAVFGADAQEDADAPYAATYAWDASATAEGRYTVEAESAGGRLARGSFTLVRDVTGPAGGSVDYADGFDADGLVPVRGDPGADAGSGVDLASAIFERQTAALEADGGCGDFDGFAAVDPQPVDVVAEGRCAKYRYRVWDNVGNRKTYTSGRMVMVDLTPPTAPGAVTATAAGPTSIAVAWQASADNLGVLGYRVLRDGQAVATTPATRYDFGWLACGTEHRLSVEAVDAAGNRSPRGELVASTAACPEPGPADAADVFVAPGGSDAGPCARTAPCASFDRAYRAALPGQVVEVAGGRYPEQTIGEDASKLDPADVVLRPAPGAAVVADAIAVKGDHVTVRGMATAFTASPGGGPVQGGVSADRDSEDVTLEDLDAGHVFIAGDHVRVLGGDFGPTVDEVSKVSGSGAQPDRPPRDVVIDGATFHDYLREHEHMECLVIAGADGLAVRRTRFDNCAIFAIFLKHSGSQVMRDVTIENDVFADSLAIAMSAMIKITSPDSRPPCESVLVRHNSIDGKLVLSDCGGDVRWESNVFSHLPAGVCEDRGAGTAFDYNVIGRGAACGPHDLLLTTGDAGYVNRIGFDLHLSLSSPAIDRGNPFSFPATDIDGDPRPLGPAPDAGADEAG